MSEGFKATEQRDFLLRVFSWISFTSIPVYRILAYKIRMKTAE
jgi:hypothetical protein